MTTDWNYYQRAFGLTPDTRPQVPAGPIETTQWGYMPAAMQRRALLDALDGVELGAEDRRLIDWLAGWDWPTVGVIASLIIRARAIGGETR